MNKTDPEGKTVLHHVLLNAHDKLLEYITSNYVEHGLNFNSVSLDGNPALHLALSSVGFLKYQARSVSCVKLILKASANAQAIDKEKDDGFLEIPNRGIDINEVDRLGRTVLHLAAMHGLSGFVAELFEEYDHLEVNRRDAEK